MKVLASADLHGVRPVYDWLLATAHKHRVDVLVLAGDLLGCLDGFKSAEAAQEYESETIVTWLDAAGVPVLYIMGNDDLVELNSRSTRIQSIHARRIQSGDFNFVGYQYSLPFMGGIFERPEEHIRADLVSLSSLMDANTVFVSHSPAQGVLDPGLGDARIGSRSVREFLTTNRFRVHIHGHSHGGFGRMGKHFNVASAGRMRAMVEIGRAHV